MPCFIAPEKVVYLPYKNKRGLIHSAIMDRASRKLSMTLDLGKDKGVTIEYQCKQSPMRFPRDTYAPPCVFEAISGDLFEFAPTYIGGEKYGYQMWNTSPSTGKGLPYHEYRGRKGKVTGEVIPSRYGDYFVFHKAVLNNCEVVYAQVSKENPEYMGAILAKDVERAKVLIGKPIWINNASVARPQELITSDPKISYPTNNIEKLIVLDVSLVRYGHARGAGSFFLKVKKSTGEEGLIKFNDRYFYVTDPIPAGTPRDIRTAIEQQKIKKME